MQGLVAQWVGRTLSKSCRLEALLWRFESFQVRFCFQFRSALVSPCSCLVFSLYVSFGSSLRYCSPDKWGLVCAKIPIAWITTWCPPFYLGKMWFPFKNNHDNETRGFLIKTSLVCGDFPASHIKERRAAKGATQDFPRQGRGPWQQPLLTLTIHPLK